MLALVILCAFGLWTIVGHSEISRPARTWLWTFCNYTAEVDGLFRTRAQTITLFAVTILECPTCFGFWTGAAIGAFQGPALLGLTNNALGRALSLLALGLLIAATNTVLAGLARIGGES